MSNLKTNPDNVYREGPSSTVRHRGRIYSVDKMLSIVHGRPIALLDTQCQMDFVTTCLKPAMFDEERIEKAVLLYPVIYIEDRYFGYIILDGLHRLLKALRQGIKTIYGVKITPEELESCLVQETSRKIWGKTIEEWNADSGEDNQLTQVLNLAGVLLPGGPSRHIRDLTLADYKFEPKPARF